MLRILLCAFMLAVSLPVLAQSSNERDSLAYRLQRLESTNRFNPKDTTHIKLLVELAFSYRYLEMDSLYSIGKRALEYSEKIDYTYGKIKGLDALGNYYYNKGEREKSMPLFQEALRLATEAKDIPSELSIINAMAQNYSFEGNYAEALNLNLKGIDLAREIDNQPMLSVLNENIAGLYADQKDFKNALMFYDTVQKINRRLGDEVIDAETQSNMASLYKDAKDYKNAMFNINRSISTFEKHKVYDWLAYAYEVKGDIYLDQEKYKWALYWYDQSNMLFKHQIEDDRIKIQLMNGMAKVYFGLEQDSLALVYAQKGLALSDKIKSLQGKIDCSETLYKVHKKNGNTPEALAYLESFKILSDSLFKDKNKQSLSLLETKLQYEQEKQELIEANETALAKQRNYIYFSVIILMILSIITFVIRRSENIQRKLNRELKEKSTAVTQREAQLHEINKTNTKLFSIIGHDLRGPIGGLQSMLNLFTDGEISTKEFVSFIPKLKTDVDNISFTLNNLLSWGMNQLNGVVTKPKRVSLSNLVNNNIQLLSEIANSKSIKIINQLPENPRIWADSHQMDIVVRNILSNAIKFTPENGLITINAVEKAGMWQVSIRDTGIGMTAEMQRSIFKDSSNITTYGTNNEKGTGLGLSLCKEMVLKNNGEIWVDSVPRKGTTFYFTVPKAVNRYQKAS
ncbi:MAG: tetratricopeptide repeat-containing sensor histidine kinase [Muricauda sp.]|nr:tetratricopeptide repeat-containing sensor histidine kinase [Allomuricauda sp.]MBO6589627.1 tetratricopeptide repeat-containing sensor histidine kinase [Allomuricauda sp.]MBO6619440.1 tetratricopeptide repeat-containing sensor histidine kinase [Allomuricauda sp.]MBO6645351.1 tetratricopeptide repeat-containing sensor histidine kinase [Allomuricauda sp.]MBO6747373.1 tetratricopeptide repeat-containing sensor histidine kinase [Allomuricauda sp.]